VPRELGAQCWTPPATERGWQFRGSAGLVNATAAAWRGPRAADGTQLAVLPGADARIAQVVDDFIPGITYHDVCLHASACAAEAANGMLSPCTPHLYYTYGTRHVHLPFL
jgi:hypothetical protein